MIDDIKINRINDKFYQINVKDNDKLKMLNVTLKNCYIPFGVEEYNKKYYLNFETDDEEFIKLVRYLERNLNSLLETEEQFDLKSVFHKKKNYNLLCKSHFKKNDNMIISKYIVDKKEMSIFDIESKKKYNLELEVSGIWIYKMTYGIILNIVKIF